MRQSRRHDQAGTSAIRGGDRRDDRWDAEPDVTLDELVEELLAQAARSTAIIEAHDLRDVGQPGGRWDGAGMATLERVLFHLAPEYARHVGQRKSLRLVGQGPSRISARPMMSRWISLVPS